jgi:hypothetical protein
MFARTSANERDKFLSFVLSRFRVLLVTDDEEILSIIESIMKSEEPLRFSFF